MVSIVSARRPPFKPSNFGVKAACWPALELWQRADYRLQRLAVCAGRRDTEAGDRDALRRPARYSFVPPRAR
jgi:hypothetical protein